MSTPTQPTPAASPSLSWPLRIAGFVVGLLLMALGLLTAIGWIFVSMQPGRAVHPDVVAALLVAVIVVLGVLAWKRVRLLGTWPRVAVGAVVAVAGLTWFAWDDPAFDHPVTLEELSGDAGSRAAESYDLTLRYSERTGHTPVKFIEGKLRVNDSPVDKPDAWLATVEKSSAEIAAEWERLAPEREWFASMDAFPAIGDDVSAGFNAPVMRFAVFRRMTTIGGARAGALALEGKGDEAADILIRQLSVCAKLERNSRTLMRSMIAVAGWRDGLAVAKFVLERASVSPEKRAALAAVIAGREDHALVLRRLVWIDFVNLRESVLERGETLDGLVYSELGAFKLLTPVARPFVFLPRHTANLQSGFLAELEALAQKRDEAGLKDVEFGFFRAFHADGPKNLGGKYAIALATPNFSRPLQRSWEVEDRRKELLALLQLPATKTAGTELAIHPRRGSG